MGFFEGFFTLLTIFFVVIPIILIALLIRYVIKKSKADQPDHVLHQEKTELIKKARAKKGSLINWKAKDLERLSNDLDFNYSKGFTMRFNGYIKSLDGDKLIAFRRLDRGNFKTTAKIIAVSSDFEIYFSQNQNDVDVFYNANLLGKIINDTIIDHNDQPIGKVNRHRDNKEYYNIEINQEQLAYVVKNSERRKLLNNPFHHYRPNSGLEKDPYYENEVSISNTLRLYRELNDYEYQWILAPALYEIIFYGIDFSK